MKVLLAAINSKYIHSNPAVYSLKAYAEKRLDSESGVELAIAEYTINQPLGRIMSDLYQRKPDVLCLSCYIWNIRETERLVQNLGKVMPELSIWLGGPEVSFDAPAVLQRLPTVKGVLCGEGEETFKELLQTLCDPTNQMERLAGVKGIAFRTDEDTIRVNGARGHIALDEADFIYKRELNFENRIIYYESSRGCPFQCSYCLSSVDKTVRLRSMEKVRQELQFFLDKKVPQVKFVDRTFNCDRNHALEIWRYIKEHDNGITNFHFELTGDLLLEEELALLNSLRPGQVQVEIGVQSTNAETLREIHRYVDFQRLTAVTERLKAGHNIHLHLDLIAGLPYEDMSSFIRSFNEVYALKPEQLQLGFLKVLKGSPLAKKQEEYGLLYTEEAPYEVLQTRWITYGELVQLKAVEEMLEVYYNSGQFADTLEKLEAQFGSPFELYSMLAEWYDKNNRDTANSSRNTKYEELLSFGLTHLESAGASESATEEFREALICDYYKRENVRSRPSFLGPEASDKEAIRCFYASEAKKPQYLKGESYEGKESRTLRNMTHLEKLKSGWYLFDYADRNPMTNNARMIRIETEM